MIDITAAIKIVEQEFGIELQNPELRQVDSDRLQIYAPYVSGAEVVAVVGFDAETKEVREFLFQDDNLVTGSCQITFEDLPLSECLEYCFDDDKEWRLAQLSQIALDDFKQKKFKLWEHQLKEPECEAAFRRLLQQGPIRNVYDKFIFPSSEDVAAKYKVRDEHSGKLVDIPHQVGSMRRWNPKLEKYQDVDCSLAGAPKNEAEAKVYWDNLLMEMKELRGTEYINSLLGQH